MWKRRQLFRATDFRSLMYPNFIFCRLLGIFPYKISAPAFEAAKLRDALRTLVFGAFCVYDGIILRTIIATEVVDYVDVTHFLQYVCYYTCGGFIATIMYVSSGPRTRALQAVLKTSLRLSPESYRELSRWIHAKDILGTLFLAAQASAYYFKFIKYLPYYVLGIYIDLLIFQTDMLYVNCVCVLKACFKAIDDNLAHLRNVVTDDVKRGPRLICDMQKEQFLLIELRSLKKQHLMVSDTAQALNAAFGLQLLVTVAQTFTDLTFETYSHVIQWQGALSVISRDYDSDAYVSSYVVYLVFKIILIVWACEACKNQAFEIGATVHDVLNRTSDKRVKKELHLFSLQVLHCARNTFTMKGLTIDATLLTAVMGNITTYVLILAQFRILPHSCDSKTTTSLESLI